MSKKSFLVVIEQDEDGVYIAKVPALKGCHTQAKTCEEVLKRIKEAILLWLEVSDINEIPEYTFTGVHQLEVDV
jgi:predicted RNase H-like HicB family nuclease